MAVLAFAFLTASTWSAPSARPLAAPAPLGFLYEGRLGVADGLYDFQFRLFDASTGGNLASPNTLSAPNVLVDGNRVPGHYERLWNRTFQGRRSCVAAHTTG